jgi:hypothetical protein
MAKVGRPSKYTPELAKRICRAIATSTDSRAKIFARYPDFPCVDTVNEWRYDYPEFSAMYAEAKRLQADLLAEEIIDISDDSTQDYYEDKDGNEKLNTEHVQRSRLRVDSRKWVACKLLPKVYGDKQEHVITNISHEQALKEIAGDDLELLEGGDDVDQV